MSTYEKIIKTPLHEPKFYTAMWFMPNVCSSNADLFARIIPTTDDVKVLANLCLVSVDWSNFFLGTLQGRKIWLDTASRATGFDGSAIINPIATDFRYQIRMLVCPWISVQTRLHFEFPDFDFEDTNQKDLLLRQGREKDEMTLIFNAYAVIDASSDDEDPNLVVEDPNVPSCIVSFSSNPNKSLADFEKTVKTLDTVPDDVMQKSVVDARVVEIINEGKIIPSYEYSATNIQLVHKTAFAIIATYGGFEGVIYFMSSRDRENPRFLRKVTVEHLDFIRDCDICASAQNLWILTTDGVVHMGRLAKPHDDTGIDKTGRMDPAFWMAARGAATEAVKFIRELGLDINTPISPTKRNLIFYAINKNRAAAIKELIGAGVNPNHVDANGATPLMHAVGQLSIDCIKVLCANGAKACSPTKNKSLLNSIGIGSPDAIIHVLDALFKAGADPNEPDARGQTLLFRPDIKQYPDVLRFLLKKGADPRIRDSDGNTILHVCYDINIMRIVIRQLGVDINAQNNAGHTALFLHAFNLTPADLRIMLEEFKADPTIKNNKGVMPYQHYKKFGDGTKTALPKRSNFDEIYALLRPKQ